MVARERIVDGSRIEAGDVLIGLPSSGLHTNGYSLARRVVFDVLGLSVDSHVAEIGEAVGPALLRPHRSYLGIVGPLLDRGWIKGMAHITGGGLTENVPRTLPERLTFSLDRQSWTVPPLFTWLQRAGEIDDAEMLRAFNMGVGMVLVCAPEVADELLATLHAAGERAWVLGGVGVGVR
jgi:phosphoribosylformylglycinamidine cyclo-ligase